MTWGGVAETERLGSTRLERWSGVGWTTLRVRTTPHASIGWVVVGAYTSRAELRKVVSVENRDITVAALTYYHDPDEMVIVLDAPTLNVRWFGAVGDGISDDTTAIQAAIDAAELVNGEVYAPKGRYIFTTLTANQPITIRGDGIGETVLLSDATDTADVAALNLTTSSPSVISTTMSAVTIGTRTITVASNSGVQAGDVVFIRKNRDPGDGEAYDAATYAAHPEYYWPYDRNNYQYYGELNVVRSTSGADTIVLEMPVATAYDQVCYVYVYRYSSGMRVHSLSIERITKTWNETAGIRTSYLKDTLVYNVKIVGFGQNGVYDTLAMNSVYAGLVVEDGWHDDPTTTNGYGVQFVSSYYGLVIDSTFRNNRRGVDISGTIPSRHCKAVNCQTYAHEGEDRSGFGTHGPAEYSTFLGCKVYNANIAFVVRGGFTDIVDCEGFAIEKKFVRFSAGAGLRITGCRVTQYHAGTYGGGFGVYEFVNITSVNIGLGRNGLVISDCYAEIGARVVLIYNPQTAAAATDIPNCQITIQNSRFLLRASTLEFVAATPYAPFAAKTYTVQVSGVSLVTYEGNDCPVNITEVASTTIDLVGNIKNIFHHNVLIGTNIDGMTEGGSLKVFKDLVVNGDLARFDGAVRVGTFAPAGSEEVTSSTFAATTGWTAVNCTFIVASNRGILTESASVSTAAIRQTLSGLTPGSRYYGSVVHKGTMSTDILGASFRIGTVAGGSDLCLVRATDVAADETLVAEFIAPAGGTVYISLYHSSDSETDPVAVSYWETCSVKEDTVASAGGLSLSGALSHTGTTVGFYSATPVTQPAALTAADASAVDATYGAEEAAVIANLRTRLGELEGKLQDLGLLA